MKLLLSLLAVVALAVNASAQDDKRKVPLESIAKIAEALPDSAPVKPKEVRFLLVYSKTLGFRHSSIETGAQALRMLGEKTRAFTVVHSEDPAMFDSDNLSKFDGVLMLNTTGDCLAPKSGDLSTAERETLERRKENLREFVASGKGLSGTHSSTDTFYSWKVYGDMIGGWFTGHPWHQLVPIKIDAPGHPLTSMFDVSKGFEVTDEIYQFAPRGANQSYDGYQPYSRDKLKVLLSLDNVKFDVSKGQRKDGDYAISWIRNYDCTF